MNYQPGILDDVPAHGRYIELAVNEPSQIRLRLDALCQSIDGSQCVLGVGQSVAQACSTEIRGLRAYSGFNDEARPSSMTREMPKTPATQADCWLWLRGDDRGVLSNESRRLMNLLSPAFETLRVVDGFRFDSGRDLTGYEDGTENPNGQAAIDAAFTDQGESFVAVQQWVHKFTRFDAMSAEQRDAVIGRHRESNEEFDAPTSAHVKRTAQEDFDPEAFVLRRSMPWSSEQGAGLMFVAFGHSLAAFDAQMRRMLGLDDGIQDALFEISQPVTGAYYWCPAMKDGRPDLTALGI